jgi:hypothetical protein
MTRAFGETAIARPVSGQVCAMLAVRITEFTRPDRDDEIRLYLRKALYEYLEDAFYGSGLPWNQCHHEDRGDGVLIIVPPDIPAQGVVGPLPERLRQLIRRDNRMSIEAARIQLRAAAHIGPVHHDDHGFVGDDIDLLFRMLEARPLHQALKDSSAELALIISAYVYDKLVISHPSLVNPALFRPLNTRVKRTRVRGWIYVPGGRALLHHGGCPRAAAGRRSLLPPAGVVRLRVHGQADEHQMPGLIYGVGCGSAGRPGSLAGHAAKPTHVRDRDVPLTGSDESAAPPVGQGTDNRRP